MVGYFSQGEISYDILSGEGGGGGKKSKRFFPGEWFTEQIFIGELSGVDSAGVLRQGVRVTTSNSEWYNDLQQMSENKWQRVVQRETTSGTTRDNKWQQMTASHNEWLFWLIFLFFWIGEEPTAMHPKENSLNIKEDPEERLLN